ncbi:MAG TPA: glycosyltransferase [Thermoanaerobaculia bacterium]|nr:glycosyltransferase [Thermoanaerobaculia bacterium]
MRILHVVPTYLPARRYGGPIVAVHGLCKALVARGHEVEVLTTNVDGGGVSDVPLDRAVELDGVRVRYFASPFPRLYWSPSMRRALDAAARAAAVVHAHSIYLWPTYAAARAAARAETPYVISPRGMLVPELIRRKSRAVKSAWVRLVERRNFANAAAIHFTSQREWDDARNIAIPLPSPFVVPNGTDLPSLPTVAREDDLVVSVGRINWKKGLDRLIESAALLPRARFVIAGNDEEHLVPKLRALAASRGVESRMEFRGALSAIERDALLARAAVFALPSHSENFGNVVLEALAMATPVVVTPEVGLAEEVQRAECGVVANGAPRELARAIGKLLDDATLRRAMGERGRALVEERFTWPRVAAEMESHYERIGK